MMICFSTNAKSSAPATSFAPFSAEVSSFESLIASGRRDSLNSKESGKGKNQGPRSASEARRRRDDSNDDDGR